MWLYRDVKREEGRWSLARTLGMSLFLMPVVACSGSSSGDGTNTNNTNTGSNKASNVAPQLASESSVFPQEGRGFMLLYFKENVEAAASLRGTSEYFENVLIEEKSSGKVVFESYILAHTFGGDDSKPTLTVTKKGKDGAADENLLLREVKLANTYKYDSSGNYDASSSSSYFEIRISNVVFQGGETYEVTIHDGFLTNRGRDIKNADIKVENDSVAFAELVSVTYHKTTSGKVGTVEVVYDKALERLSPSESQVIGQEKNYKITTTTKEVGKDLKTTTLDFGVSFLFDGGATSISSESVLEVRALVFKGTMIIFDIKDKTTLPESISFSAGQGTFVSGPDFKWTVVSAFVQTDKPVEPYRATSHEDDLVGLSFLDIVDF